MINSYSVRLKALKCRVLMANAHTRRRECRTERLEGRRQMTQADTSNATACSGAGQRHWEAENKTPRLNRTRLTRAIRTKKREYIRSRCLGRKASGPANAGIYMRRLRSSLVIVILVVPSAPQQYIDGARSASASWLAGGSTRHKLWAVM